MREGWQSKPFEDCLEKVAYTTKIQRKDFLDVGVFPVVSQEDAFINGYWNDPADVFRVETPLVIFGDHTKVLKYVDFDFVLGADGVKVLPPKKFLVPKFFYYQLQTAQLDSLGYARHYKLLRELEIRYPDRAEQHRIVAILDEAFDGIATAKANAEKNFQNGHALFESHLQSVFTERGEVWRDISLGKVCSIARGGSPRPIQKFITTTADGINWIKIGDATAGGKYIHKTAEKIIPEGAKRSRTVHDGDFLLSNSMSFGRPYIMRTTGCIHDGWLVLSDYSEHLDQDYLYYVLGSQYVYSQFDRLAAGSTVRNLNIDLASRVVIPIPPLARQRDIANQFDAISEEVNRLTSLYQQKVTALDDLKKSLLHQAFSGQL